MPMDQFLAEYYGTTKTASAEDYEAQASVELFMKVASDEGIDLSSMADEQVNALYSNWVKAAAEESKKDEHEEHESEKEEKVEEAKKEHEEKKAAAEKVAEADFLGRVMAHSYVQELNKIAMGPTEAGMRLRHMDFSGLGERAGKAISEGARSAGRSLKDIATGKQLREGLQAKKNLAHPQAKTMAAKFVMQHAAPGEREKAMKAILSGAAGEAHKNVTHGAAKTLGLYGGGGGALAAGAYLAKKHHDKKASALDELAAETAVEKAAEAGWDVEEAAGRLSAVLTLGAGESEKIAAADDLDTAVGIRSLELLEMAGYPVEWA